MTRLLLAMLLFGCTPRPTARLQQLPVAGALAWCVSAVTKKGELLRLCTRLEHVCRWAERNARKYGRLADLKEVGTCRKEF